MLLMANAHRDNEGDVNVSLQINTFKATQTNYQTSRLQIPHRGHTTLNALVAVDNVHLGLCAWVNYLP
jgi:hypothetical protein